MDKNLLRDTGDTIEQEFEMRGWRRAAGLSPYPPESYPAVARASYAEPMPEPQESIASVNARRTARELRHAFWKAALDRSRRKALMIAIGATLGYIVVLGGFAWYITHFHRP